MLQKKYLGRIGEGCAVLLLVMAGYRILRKNSRIHGVEVDILAQRRQRLVICEVKTRRRALSAEAPLHPHQHMRLCRVQNLLAARSEHPVAIDCLCFSLHFPFVRWYQNL